MINTEQKKTWTLMFFFASDNTLSPSTLSQLKAIKAAGSQFDTNVVVYFDPNEKGAPTRIFEINKTDKSGQSQSNIGNPDGPLVSVLTDDNIDPHDAGKFPGTESRSFASSLTHLDKLDASTALSQFLGFCRESYPADHYMLFLVGHGLVVGRDAFLPDDNPDSAIGLTTLGEILKTFKERIKANGEVLELIGMHSCSMSSVEVAYQLKGTASYMMASQGISFVGSWPYRQLLVELYNTVERQRKNVDVLELVKKLHSLCLQYSVDFMYAGYSADICLCSLDPARIQRVTDPISKLAKALQDGLDDVRCRELILLAHWKSQSYWQETYTDLYDFCLCLRRLCDQTKRCQTDGKEQQQQAGKERQFVKRDYDVKRLAIMETSKEVMDRLAPQNSSGAIGPIVSYDFIGPDVQYSHGLSIYFPWAHPVEDENDHVLENYGDYAFTADSTTVTWLAFLEQYFTKTRRQDRLAEDRDYGDQDTSYANDPAYKAALETAKKAFAAAVATDGRDVTPISVLEGKVSPPDSGGACTCASTKNHPREFSMSRGAAPVFGKSRSRPARAA